MIIYRSNHSNVTLYFRYRFDTVHFFLIYPGLVSCFIAIVYKFSFMSSVTCCQSLDINTIFKLNDLLPDNDTRTKTKNRLLKYRSIPIIRCLSSWWMHQIRCKFAWDRKSIRSVGVFINITVREKNQFCRYFSTSQNEIIWRESHGNILNSISMKNISARSTSIFARQFIKLTCHSNRIDDGFSCMTWLELIEAIFYSTERCTTKSRQIKTLIRDIFHFHQQWPTRFACLDRILPTTKKKSPHQPADCLTNTTMEKSMRLCFCLFDWHVY